MYDIACVLVKHLKKRRSTIPDKNLSFCIPSFHVYGHKSACQLQYSPKSTVGIGISDGEVMERLWSTLRRFSKITKEQTPSHRADTISLGLLHYAQYSINALGRRLCARYDKALKLRDTTNIQLEQTLKSVNVSNRDIIQSWIEAEIDMEEYRIQKIEKASDLESYALILDDWWKLRNDIAFNDRNLESFMELERLEKELNNKEKKLKINVRWDLTTHTFKDIITAVYERKRNFVRQRVQSFAFQKLLLNGQKIAIKLSKQLNKNNKRLQDAIKEFNSISLLYPSNTLPNIIVWDEVTNLESAFWKTLNDEPEALIAITVKRKCVELYQLNCRAIEEIEMLKNEMQSVLDFYNSTINRTKKV